LKPKDIQTKYLWTILRSDIVQKPLERSVTEALMPAIPKKEAVNVKILVHSDEIQIEISHNTAETISKAKNLACARKGLLFQ